MFRLKYSETFVYTWMKNNSYAAKQKKKINSYLTQLKNKCQFLAFFHIFDKLFGTLREEIFANLPLFRENFFREMNNKFSFAKISSAKKIFPKEKEPFFVGTLFFKRFFKKHVTKRFNLKQ